MSLSTRVTLSFIAGAFSGLLAWILIDFNGVWRLSPSASTGSFGQIFAQQAVVGVIFGICVGVAIGVVNGLSAGSRRVLARNILWGLGVGLGGGLVGLYFGQLFFGALYQLPERMFPLSGLGPLFFIWNVMIRAIGWSLIGLFLGLAQGIPSGSKKASRHGAIGGFIGGFIGGTLFEVVPWALPFGAQSGIMSRGISMTITGAAIGLFIGLAETLLKQAWVRVVQGRNEGREYIISKQRTTIGRDELSDIGLFGDRSVSPLHAVIEHQNGRHILRDAGSQIGVTINGQRVTEQMLRDGDSIGVGSMRLDFHEKATASKIAKPSDESPKPAVRIPAQTGICPFCGGRKDPATGDCACSVGGQPGVSPEQMPAAPFPATGPHFIGTVGPYAGQIFDLSTSGETTVGRDPSRTIQLSMDTTVSRLHAHIANEGGDFVVYDDGSSNGTTVNGMRVNRQQLVSGDTVSFGTSAFRFVQ
jgi:pSer/pThr/pTyr-binding forkhead associated (FHA) protein